MGAAPPKKTDPLAMKKCSSCQQSNADEASFCTYCGAHMPDVSETMDEASSGAPAISDGTVPGSPLTGAFQQSAEPVEAAPGMAGMLVPGMMVDGKYSIESVLGEGGMGVVYLARDIHTQVEVVVKAIRAEYAHRQEFRDRILAEGRALAHIDHPNVVRLNAVVVEPDAMYLVMQFIDGESLDRTIERHVQNRTPLPVAEVLRVFRQVVEGVGAAHAQGVIHRDLKPANILIRKRDGVAKVTDFGIAKAEEDAQAGRGQTKGIIGSLLYMAPEQITGRRDLDKRVDIYGLGILLYELLVGRVPFDAPSEFEIMKLHLEGQLPLVSSLRGDVSRSLDAVIQRACAKDRNHRFASTEDLALAIDEATKRPAATAAATPASAALQTPPPERSVAAGSTNEGVVGPSVEPKRSSLRWIVVTMLLLMLFGGGGVGGAVAMGWIDVPSSGRHRPKPVPTPTVTVDAAVVDAPAEAAAPKSPLAALEGEWRSDSGRVYDAEISGNALEFRIRDAKGMREDGYMDGEPRFTLSALPGENEVFAVKDKIRPTLPTGLTYDLERSRSTCQEVRTLVNGAPLRARYGGSQLTVEGAKIAPDRSMFLREGTKVYGCVRLSESKASRIEGIFRRP